MSRKIIVRGTGVSPAAAQVAADRDAVEAALTAAQLAETNAETAEASAETAQAAAEAARDAAVDISNISTSDGVVEALVLNTAGAGPLTSAALSATYGLRFGRPADSAKAASDRAVSAGASLIAHADAEEWAETWATDTSAWGNPTRAQVVGGYCYNVDVGTPSGLVRAFAVADGAPFRVVGTLRVVAPGTGPDFSVLAVSNTSALGALDLIGIGVHQATSKPFLFNGPASNYTTPTDNLSDASALTPGDYLVTITGDATTIGLILSSPDRPYTFEWHWQVPRAGFTVQSVALWNKDTRNASGNGFGPIIAKKAISTSRTPTTVEGRNDWTIYGKTGGTIGTTRQRMVVPATYDSRKPAPLVIYSHGYSENVTRPSGWGTALDVALTNAGFILAAGDATGMSNTGQQSCIDEYLRIYRYCRDNLAISSVIIIGASAGGLGALNLIQRRLIPGIAGFIGIYPVVDLAAWYVASGVNVKANFGIAADGSDYATKTAGFDPMLADNANYAGIPMWLEGSPADTVVSKTVHMDAFAAKVAGVVPELVTTATTGEHGDSSNYNTTQIASLLAFAQRCTGQA